MSTRIELKPIGVIRTPYKDAAPFQPVEDSEGNFRIILEPEYARGLYRLSRFRYIYVLYYMNRVHGEPSLTVHPPWAGGYEVGLFASRSPARPNPIGLSVVRLLGIEGRVIRTSGLDAYDRTPLIDIKPYIQELDVKKDANDGWLDDVDARRHLQLHLKGIPHEH